MSICRNGASGKLKSLVPRKTGLEIPTRTGMLRLIGTINVGPPRHLTSPKLTSGVVPPADAGAYKSPFFQDFIHLNVAMATSNNALVPDPDKQDDLASKFWQWPILHVGLRMCGWDDSTVKYFL